MRFLGTVACVMVLAATGALAQTMLADFEDGNPFSGGTVVADPDNASNNVLYVESGTVTLDLAAPLAADEAISMKVYDHGKSAMDDPAGGIPAEDSRPAGTKYGWNLGVGGTYNWGVALVNKSFLGANGGYGWTDTYYDGWPQTATSIWSVGWFGGPRQCDALSVIGTGTVADPEFPGDGAWSTWTFTYNADGSMTIGNDGGGEKTTDAVESAITQIYVASTSSDLGGVWIDDVQVSSGAPVCNPGDADGDGDVDLDDFVILKNNFGVAEGATCDMGDFDGDGDVDLDDFVLLKNNFGATY
ncbi:MAG: hypothetical protein ACOC95_06875 [Planctomycetota bacterium]